MMCPKDRNSYGVLTLAVPWSHLQVQVSMKFNGQSSVEVQPHTNVEDLKTVTAISLFIRVDPDKDPIEDRFIFYLGDRNVSGLDNS